MKELVSGFVFWRGLGAAEGDGHPILGKNKLLLKYTPNKST